MYVEISCLNHKIKVKKDGPLFNILFSGISFPANVFRGHIYNCELCYLCDNCFTADGLNI